MTSKYQKVLLIVSFIYFSTMELKQIFAQSNQILSNPSQQLFVPNFVFQDGSAKINAGRDALGFPVLTKNVKHAQLENFKPLQGTLGKALVKFKSQSLLEEADLIRQATGTDLKIAVTEVLKREANVGLLVYRDPDGFLRPVDAHHKLAVILDLAVRFNINFSEISVLVNLKDENDFLGAKWQSFFLELEKEGFLIRSDNQSFSESDIQKEFESQIAKSFEQMMDSPSRSTLSRIFDIIDIKGADFKPMVQQKLVDFLKAQGVQITSGEEFHGLMIGRILSVFYSEVGELNPKISKILADEVREKSQKGVWVDLETFGVHFAKVRRELKRGIVFNEVDFNKDITALSKKDVETGKGAELIERIGNLFLGLSDFNIKILPLNVQIYENKDFYKTLLDDKSISDEPIAINKIKQILKEISKKDFKKSDRSGRRALKKFRIYTLRIRTLYQFLSKEHDEPKSLDKFSFELGLLNDLIDKWSEGRETEKNVAEVAEKLLSQLEKEEVNFDLDFKVSKFNGKNGVGSYIKQINKEMIDLLQQKHIKVAEYHWLRRRVRSFGIFFETLASSKEQIEFIILNSFLEKVSDRMGLVKDGLLTSEWSDKVKDPENQQTQIDEKTKKMLMAFSNLMKQALDSTEEK